MISADVVSEVLGLSPASVYKLAATDDLPFPTHRFGKVYRFRRSDVEAFLGEPLDEQRLRHIDHVCVSDHDEK